MNVFDWLMRHFSNRGQALSLYKRGPGPRSADGVAERRFEHAWEKDETTISAPLVHQP
jgi:hypothetical protein